MGSQVLLVSIHDVAPPTASAARRWVELLTPTRIPLTFLAVPGPWRGARFGDRGDDGLDMAAWLRARQAGGDEICVHGWCHRADVPGSRVRRWSGAVVARGAGEFWALDRATAATRIAAGMAVLDGCGLSVTGTTPPGWLASSAARDGMADAGLTYTTDHLGVIDLASRRRWAAPALCHRPAATARRACAGSWQIAEPSTVPASARIAEGIGRRVVRSASRLVRAGGSVRIALHPADLDRPGLAEATVSAVLRCLDAGAVATTYGQVARQLRNGRRG